MMEHNIGGLPVLDERSLLVGMVTRTDIFQLVLERDTASASELVEQLREADRIKAELLAMVSHDLRSPLTVIQGYTKMMKSQRYGSFPEVYMEMLEEQDTCGTYMLRLLEDLMDVGQLGCGALQLHCEPVELVGVAREVLSTCTSLAVQKDVSLGFFCEREAVAMEADPIRLRQVMMNLLTNAIKFNHPGGSVTICITLLADSDEVEVRVIDTGSGIAIHDQPRVFDMFRRLDAHRTIEGAGLGLTISKALIELHRGRIGVESELGVGSTFYFLLPLRQSTTTAAMVAVASPSVS